MTNFLSVNGLQFDKLDIYLVILVATLMAVIFKLKPSMPSISTIQTAVELLNTKGGIISLLGTFSMVFFFIGVRFIYWSANMILDNKIRPDNAIVISGFNWITGIAFGGAFGAMIKTMTGESPPSTKSITQVETPQATTVQTTVTTAATETHTETQGDNNAATSNG